MALTCVALFYGLDPEGSFAVSVGHLHKRSWTLLPLHCKYKYKYKYKYKCMHAYIHMFQSLTVSSKRVVYASQVPKMAMTSVFSFLFMIPIGTIVPWMFQVQ